MSTSFQELDDGHGAFDLARWRRMVTRAARRAGIDEALVPFGFEVLNDRQFLRGALDRFSVYVATGAPASTCPALARELVASLDGRAPSFLADIAVIWGPRGALTQGAHASAMRQIAIWPIAPIGVPLVERWANYLLATPRAMLEGRLRESARAPDDHHALRYLLQLSVIQEALLADRVGPIEWEARTSTLEHIRRLEHGEDTAARTGALRLLEEVGFPYARCAVSHLESAPLATRIGNVVDFHGGRPLALTASPAERDALVGRVVASYACFADTS